MGNMSIFTRLYQKALSYGYTFIIREAVGKQ
jgi:hypothetical protein